MSTLIRNICLLVGLIVFAGPSFANHQHGHYNHVRSWEFAHRSAQTCKCDHKKHLFGHHLNCRCDKSGKKCHKNAKSCHKHAKKCHKKHHRHHHHHTKS